MFRYHHSLNTHLTVIALLTTTLTMLIATSVFLLLESHLSSRDSQHQLQAVSLMMAKYSAHELEEGHHDDLQKTIQSLGAAPNITLGCLYAANGQLVAAYKRNVGINANCPLSNTSLTADPDELSRILPVTSNNKVIGTLLVQHDQSDVQQRRNWFIQAGIVMLLLSMLLAAVAATRFRDSIVTPFQAFGRTIQKISQGSDLSRRINDVKMGELKEVAEQLNKLLHTLEQQHHTLGESEARFRKLAAFSPVGIFQVDINNQLQYVNQRWRDIHNLHNGQPDMDQWFNSITATDAEAARKEWQLLTRQQESIELDLRLQKRDGSHCWIHLMAGPMHDREGQVVGYLGAISDISELKAAQLQMENLAFYDPLTGLANRRLFKNRLSKAIKSAQRSQSTLALMFLDMDQFKRINDSMGHDAGDLLLQEVARRLSSNVRDRDTVSRIGGDEFTILLTDVNLIADVRTVAEKLLTALSAPIRIKGQDINTSVSIGITLTPQDSSDTNILMKNADLAMYKAKELGRNNYQFFSEDMNREILEHLSWEQEIREALQENQFSLAYQPKVCLQSYAMTGMEALIRWHHPMHGFIPPDKFIRVAEETGQIIDIGSWVLQHSCQQTRDLINDGKISVNTRVAVNLSAKQFADPELANTVRKCLQQTGLSPANLELEITESTLMIDVDKAIATMTELRDLGIQFAIDDFGTGYSSLAYLKRLPIEVLKVDRSFVRDIPEDSNDMAITAAVIAMAHKLGIQVVAEGVESEDQVDFLRRNYCDQGQGYLFSRPLDLPQLEEFLLRTNAMQLSDS